MDIILNSSAMEMDRKELAVELVKFLSRAQEDALELLFDDVVAKHLAAAADRLESRYGINGGAGYTRNGHAAAVAEQRRTKSAVAKPVAVEREGDTAMMLERMLNATQEVARRIAAIESEIKTVGAKLRAA